MYCINCGKEVKETEKFCPHCGHVLQKKPQRKDFVKEEKNSKLNSLLKKWWFWVCCVAAVIIIVAVIPGAGGNSKEVIEKLEKFTDVDKTDTRYVFDYAGEWMLKYTDVNEVVEFNENSVYDCLVGLFSDYDIGNDGSFVYDLDAGELRIYMDYISQEGSISIITYNIADDKFTVMMDGKHYSVTDEFMEYMKMYGIVDIMKADIEDFRNVLESNGLTVEQVTELKYKNIEAYMK